MAHTPGPWAAKINDAGHDHAITSDAPGHADIRIGWANQRILHAEESADNARLIAAAPTLLAAADETWKGLDRLIETWDEHSPEHIRGQIRDYITEVLCPAVTAAKGQTP